MGVAAEPGSFGDTTPGCCASADVVADPGSFGQITAGCCASAGVVAGIGVSCGKTGVVGSTGTVCGKGVGFTVPAGATFGPPASALPGKPVASVKPAGTGAPVAFLLAGVSLPAGESLPVGVSLPVGAVIPGEAGAARLAGAGPWANDTTELTTRAPKLKRKLRFIAQSFATFVGWVGLISRPMRFPGQPVTPLGSRANLAVCRNVRADGKVCPTVLSGGRKRNRHNGSSRCGCLRGGSEELFGGAWRTGAPGRFHSTGAPVENRITRAPTTGGTTLPPDKAAPVVAVAVATGLRPEYKNRRRPAALTLSGETMLQPSAGEHGGE
jgi:hypothetical protein